MEISIEIVYGDAEEQILIRRELSSPLTVETCLKAVLPNCLLDENLKVGIFGQRVSLDRVLQPHDRIEIYRALFQDPKEARRKKQLKTTA